jgi:hypothetical protein
MSIVELWSMYVSSHIHTSVRLVPRVCKHYITQGVVKKCFNEKKSNNIYFSNVSFILHTIQLLRCWISTFNSDVDSSTRCITCNPRRYRHPHSNR